MAKLIYVPVERRKDRYTSNLYDWTRKAFQRHGVAYDTVEGSYSSSTGKGTIYDWANRSRWTAVQNYRLIERYQSGQIQEGDVIYFEDVLHPGVEGLRLAMPDIPFWGWLHGTCFDRHDFMARIPFGQEWEEMLGRGVYTGMFTANQALADLYKEGLELDCCTKLIPSGHVWDSEMVLEQGGIDPRTTKRRDRVVWSSRWDKCKDPMRFLELARHSKEHGNQYQFVVCTANSDIRSDDPHLVDELMRASLEGTVQVMTDLHKKEYYNILATSKVLFSSSMMDWTSYILLEGAAFGCYPMFPDTRSFQEALRGSKDYLYPPDCPVWELFVLLGVLMRDEHFTPEAIEGRQWIHEQYNNTWAVRLVEMGLVEVPV